MSKYFNGDKLSGYEDSPITYVYGNNLEECHKVIADLETNLAEKDKQIKELEEENQQLKQQLNDLPKKIMEDVTNELSNNTSLYFEMRESTSAHCPNQEYEWLNYVRFRDYVNAILKKYGGEDE